MKYKIIYQQPKPNRIKKTRFFLTKIKGNNQWYYNEDGKWGELGEYDRPVTNGNDNLKSIKSIIRHIKKSKPKSDDVYNASTRYMNYDIYIIIK